MAVDAGHLSAFPSQLIPNRGIMNPVESGSLDHIYASAATPAMGYRAPISGDSTIIEASSIPLYASAAALMKAAAETSDLTYNVPASAPVSRKRPRDSLVDPFVSFPSTVGPTKTNHNGNGCTVFNFLGEDVSIQILQQQLEIDHFISLHMEKMRIEMEERRRRQSRRILAAVETAMMERLRAKEEEIQKMGKLNWALEERVRSLCVENQIWKDLAQSNEATANALRSNLQQALAEASGDLPKGSMRLEEDAESCCGSTAEAGAKAQGGNCERDVGGERSGGWCRSCGEVEASVLLLPCRHLCLCTVCGPTLHTCPICHAHKNASVHVNLA